MDGSKGGTCEIKKCIKKQSCDDCPLHICTCSHVLLKVTAMEKMKTFHDLMLTFI